MEELQSYVTITPEGLDWLDREVVADEVALQDVRARFNALNVITIKADKVLPKSESCSETGWGGKFKVIRSVGEAVGTFRSFFKHSHILRLQPLLPSDYPERDHAAELAEVYGVGSSTASSLSSRESSDSTLIRISDQVLAYKLGEPDYTSVPFISLFGLGDPLLSDIQQSNDRGTCSSLSAAATYIASPLGRDLFRQMFTEDGDHVCIRLFSALLDKDILARVGCSTIQSKEGRSLFSMPSSGAGFIVALEKALLGLNLSYQQVVEDCAADCSHQYKEHWIRLLEGRRGRFRQAKLDYINSARILEHFPAVCINAKNPVKKPEVIKLFTPDSPDLKRGWENTKRTIVYNAKRGVPMVFGTRKDFKGVSFTLKTGTPTGHSVAFLRFAVDGKSGREAILVFDPYGNSLGQGLASGLESSIYNCKIEHELVLSGQASPIQAVYLDDIPERFSELVMARGAEQDIPEEPVEASFCFVDFE